MAYFHGVKGSEVATSVLATASATAGLPVIFGTAPNPKYVNKPIICYSWNEAVEAFGYSADWDKFTLCEAMYGEFKLYNVAPAVFVNVLDPAKHKTSVSAKAYDVGADKTITLTDAVILSTLTVKNVDYVATADTDYVAAQDDEGNTVITIMEDGSLKSATSVTVSYDAVDPSAVTASDIINALELLDVIYTMTSLFPGLVVAPGFSEDPTVASVMCAKARNIDGIVSCTALTDIDTSQAKKYSDVYAWKNKNGYTNNGQVACWPCGRNGEMVFHLSTHIMGIIGALDASNEDIPYQSPSNQTMRITGLCLKDGTEVMLSLSQANLLNSQGIVTALNFNGGWKSWGNNTAVYPSNTDVKDAFICVRRMFDWQKQTFILTYWQKVDQPLTPRLIKTIVDSEQIRLNGLVSRGYLLGASVQFLESDNPTTDLLAGIIRLRVKITPPVPAQDVEDITEYDVSNLETLFS